MWADSNQSIPADLTGATVKAEIREKSAGTIIVPLSATIVQPNLVNISITPIDYVTCPSKGVWDLQLTFADGKVQTPIAGAVTVEGDVTDSVVMPVTRRNAPVRAV